MATTPRKLREVQQRERHLLDVARRMLVEHGYAGLSMDRLAEATEYSKGTVYLHFRTKEDLVMALASQSMEQRAALFDRAAHFRGRPREKMMGIGVADELFAKLYPQSFRSELIIKMADLDERASDGRREALRAQDARCLGIPMGIAQEAVALGDLRPDLDLSRVMMGILTLAIGTHVCLSNFRPLLAQIRVVDPFAALGDNIQILLDGFGWEPLSGEWDYAGTRRRIATEVFADEFRTAGLG